MGDCYCHYSLEKYEPVTHLGLSPTIHQFEGKTSFRKENQATMALYELRNLSLTKKCQKVGLA
jgi:hypothetical protein